MNSEQQLSPPPYCPRTKVLNAEATSYYGKTYSPKGSSRQAADLSIPIKAACSMGGYPCGMPPRVPPPPISAPMGVVPVGTVSKPSAPILRHQQQLYDFILVVDFEATCQENNFSFPNEIIEFPVVVVETRTNSVVAEFHSYVRPKLFGGKLTEFCTALTGISQAQVDTAPSIEEVLEKFKVWIAKTIPGFSLGNTANGPRVIVATDGPTDMENFMYKHSVLRDGVKSFPRLFYTYLDVRRSFCSYSCNYRRNLGPKAMLAELGLEFEGRLHSGLDDTRNIARIVMAMVKGGFVFFEAYRVSERHLGQSPLGPPSYGILDRSPTGAEPGKSHSALANPVAPAPPAAMGAAETGQPCVLAKAPAASTMGTMNDGDGDDDGPYLLPQAAVDIVSGGSKKSPEFPERKLLPSSNSTKEKGGVKVHQDPTAAPKKRFATGRSVKIGAQHQHQHSSHLPPDERKGCGGRPPPKSVASSNSLEDLSKLDHGDRDRFYTSASEATNSPGLTSNSSFTTATTLPSSATSSPLHFGIEGRVVVVGKNTCAFGNYRKQQPLYRHKRRGQKTKTN